MMTNSRFYPLSKVLFCQKIEPLILKHAKRSGRPPTIEHYDFFCGVLYLLRTGVSWRDIYPNALEIGTRFILDLRGGAKMGYLSRYLNSFRKLLARVQILRG